MAEHELKDRKTNTDGATLTEPTAPEPGTVPKLSPEGRLAQKFAQLSARLDQLPGLVAKIDALAEYQSSVLGTNLAAIKQSALLALAERRGELAGHLLVQARYQDAPNLSDVHDAGLRAVRVQEEVRSAREALRTGVPTAFRDEGLFIGLSRDESLVTMRVQQALQNLGLPTKWNAGKAENLEELQLRQAQGEISNGIPDFRVAVLALRLWKLELDRLNLEAAKQGVPEFHLEQLDSAVARLANLDQQFAVTGEQLFLEFGGKHDSNSRINAVTGALETETKSHAFAPFHLMQNGELEAQSDARLVPFAKIADNRWDSKDPPIIGVDMTPSSKAEVDELISLYDRLQMGAKPLALQISQPLRERLGLGSEFADAQRREAPVVNVRNNPFTDDLPELEERLFQALVLPKNQRADELLEIARGLHQTVLESNSQVRLAEEFENTPFHRTAEIVDLFTNPLAASKHMDQGGGRSIAYRARNWRSASERDRAEVRESLDAASASIIYGNHADGVAKLLKCFQIAHRDSDRGERYQAALHQTEIQSGLVAANAFSFGFAATESALARLAQRAELATAQAARELSWKRISMLEKSATSENLASAHTPAITREELALRFPGLKSRIAPDVPPATPYGKVLKPGSNSQLADLGRRWNSGGTGGIPRPVNPGGGGALAAHETGSRIRAAVVAGSSSSGGTTTLRAAPKIRNLVRVGGANPGAGQANTALLDDTIVRVADDAVVSTAEVVITPARSSPVKPPDFPTTSSSGGLELAREQLAPELQIQRSGQQSELAPIAAPTGVVPENPRPQFFTIISPAEGHTEVSPEPSVNLRPEQFFPSLSQPAASEQRHKGAHILVPGAEETSVSNARRRSPAQEVEEILETEFRKNYDLSFDSFERRGLIEDVQELLGRRPSRHELREALESMGMREELAERLLGLQDADALSLPPPTSGSRLPSVYASSGTEAGGHGDGSQVPRTDTKGAAERGSPSREAILADVCSLLNDGRHSEAQKLVAEAGITLSDAELRSAAMTDARYRAVSHLLSAGKLNEAEGQALAHPFRLTWEEIESPTFAMQKIRAVNELLSSNRLENAAATLDHWLFEFTPEQLKELTLAKVAKIETGTVTPLSDADSREPFGTHAHQIQNLPSRLNGFLLLCASVAARGNFSELGELLETQLPLARFNQYTGEEFGLADPERLAQTLLIFALEAELPDHRAVSETMGLLRGSSTLQQPASKLPPPNLSPSADPRRDLGFLLAKMRQITYTRAGEEQEPQIELARQITPESFPLFMLAVDSIGATVAFRKDQNPTRVALTICSYLKLDARHKEEIDRIVGVAQTSMIRPASYDPARPIASAKCLVASMRANADSSPLEALNLLAELNLRINQRLAPDEKAKLIERIVNITPESFALAFDGPLARFDPWEGTQLPGLKQQVAVTLARHPALLLTQSETADLVERLASSPKHAASETERVAAVWALVHLIRDGHVEDVYLALANRVIYPYPTLHGTDTASELKERIEQHGVPVNSEFFSILARYASAAHNVSYHRSLLQPLDMTDQKRALVQSNAAELHTLDAEAQSQIESSMPPAARGQLQSMYLGAGRSRLALEFYARTGFEVPDGNEWAGISSIYSSEKYPCKISINRVSTADLHGVFEHELAHAETGLVKPDQLLPASMRIMDELASQLENKQQLILGDQYGFARYMQVYFERALAEQAAIISDVPPQKLGDPFYSTIAEAEQRRLSDPATTYQKFYETVFAVHNLLAAGTDIAVIQGHLRSADSFEEFLETIQKSQQR